MASDQTDPRYQTLKELAGPYYEEMIRSRDAALENLSALDCRVRIAAVTICESTWKCGRDSRFVEACRNIAASNADDFFRICAIHAFGRVFASSRTPDASAFLADLAVDSTNSVEVRRSAYWALREIQFGLADTDFDSFLKGMICSIKPVLRAYPERLSEDTARSSIVPHGRFPGRFWESAEEIDWDFVAEFASRK